MPSLLTPTCLMIGCLSLAAHGADLATNIENIVSGTEPCTTNAPVAISFTTGAATHELSTVALLLAGTVDALPVVMLHEDGGMRPGELLGSLMPLAAPPATLMPLAFEPPQPLTLQPASVYWLVLNTDAGALEWAWSEDDTGTGPGFEHDWARVAHDSGLWWNHARYGLLHHIVVDADTAACPGDTNNDGMVGAEDLLMVLGDWGGTGPGDVNDDGLINVEDVLLVVSTWGACP